MFNLCLNENKCHNLRKPSETRKKLKSEILFSEITHNHFDHVLILYTFFVPLKLLSVISWSVRSPTQEVPSPGEYIISTARQLEV